MPKETTTAVHPSHRMHDYVIERVMRSPLSYAKIAARVGMNVRTLEKLARRENNDTRISTLQPLYNFFIDTPEDEA